MPLCGECLSILVSTVTSNSEPSPAALRNTLNSLRVQFPAPLTKQLSGNRREVQQGNAGVETCIRAVGIGSGICTKIIS